MLCKDMNTWIYVIEGQKWHITLKINVNLNILLVNLTTAQSPLAVLAPSPISDVQSKGV